MPLITSGYIFAPSVKRNLPKIQGSSQFALDDFSPRFALRVLRGNWRVKEKTGTSDYRPSITGACRS